MFLLTTHIRGDLRKLLLQNWSIIGDALDIFPYVSPSISLLSNSFQLQIKTVDEAKKTEKYGEGDQNATPKDATLA